MSDKQIKYKFNRKGRIIIRNLPFKTNEDNFKEYFEKFGKIQEIKLLKKQDGKLVGCGFVQYERTQDAAKAIYHVSFKPFLDRVIVADWALPKDKYEKSKNIESINQTDSAVEIKENDSDQEHKDDIKTLLLIDEIKKEPLDDETKESPIEKTNSENDSGDSKNNSEESESDSESECDSDKTDPKEELKKDSELNFTKLENNEKKQKYFSHDVNEGKTVFIKNLPFSVDNNELKEFMKQFGRIYYALVCKDPLTEHSRGSGFVKFVEQESAEKCLEMSKQLTMNGNVLDMQQALEKNDILNKKNKLKNTKKDSRNLYLIKEGVIHAGSKAAEGVSAIDMAKRLQLEQWKSQMLRNLNMFVSKTRLVVHNLPSSWDDKKLRQLIEKHSQKQVVIKEARVMRNMRDLDANGVGKSKEYGFVTFTEHENALFALRSLNNNPNVFGEKRRPIVAFSIENRAVLNKKQKRLEMSKKKNPICKDFDKDLLKDESKNKTKDMLQRRDKKRTKLVENNNIKKDENIARTNKKKKNKKSNKNKDVKDNNQNKKEEIKNKGNAQKRKISENSNSPNKKLKLNSEYMGYAARQGDVQKFTSKSKLKHQAQVHHNNLKKEKRRKKIKKIFNEKIKQPKQKTSKKFEKNDRFSKIINKYSQNKKDMSSKKNKWYD